ncbi:MAG: subclass B1 metallo-beta-lactamase [Planctomycetota bacterium]|jgi:metallo-beta-lactamase class B
MRTIFNNTAITLTILLSCLPSTGCGSKPYRSQYNNVKPTKLSEDVIVEEISPGIWLHTTYMHVQGYGKVGANGLIIINGQIAIMIDLPWTNKQTGILFDWVNRKHHANIHTVVPTHSHVDCAGGLTEAHRRGADSIALKKTIRLMAQANTPLAKKGFDEKMDLEVGDLSIELSHIGGGHTVDNIVAWIEDCKVLFAGCLLKGLGCETIGNTVDADLKSYPETLVRMIKEYGEAMVVVPGHGKPGGLELIDHTENLLKQYIEHRGSSPFRSR